MFKCDYYIKIKWGKNSLWQVSQLVKSFYFIYLFLVAAAFYFLHLGFSPNSFFILRF